MNRALATAVALVVMGMVGVSAGTPAAPEAAPAPALANSTLGTKALAEARQYLSPESTLLASLPFPRHLLATVALVAKWLWAHGSLVALGAVVTLGLCALTPFCALSFTKFETLPELPEGFYRSLTSPTLLEQAHTILDNALDKYNSMQQ